MLILSVGLGGCVGKTDVPSATPSPVLEPSVTATETLSPNEPLPSPTSTEVIPEPSPTVALPDDIAALFPMAFPIAPFTDEQIQEAGQCREASGDAPQTACDWALRALALNPERDELDEEVTFTASGMPDEEAIDAYLRAVALNPAIVLAMPRYPEAPTVYGGMVGSPAVVAAPEWDAPIATVQIESTEVSIQYATTADVLIEGVDGSPRVTGTVVAADHVADTEVATPIFGAPSEGDLQKLMAALTDLVPINEVVYAAPGISYALAWDVTLTLADGQILTVTTNRSLVHVSGGPWQVEIEGQWYVQASNAFGEALRPILLALNWPSVYDDAAMRTYYGGDIPPLVVLAFP